MAIDDRDSRVATSETARGINRGIVLNLIRKRQPISRADLARVSGLPRSTVSLITEQLIREKCICGSIGRLPRGRRPTLLQLNDRHAIMVVDLRPTITTLAIADANGRFLSQQEVPTPTDARTASLQLVEKVRAMIASRRDLVFEGIGVECSGKVSTKKGNQSTLHPT